MAFTVAKEAVDDILDWMLEGWYFGERESSFAALGLVPSVADGPGPEFKSRARPDYSCRCYSEKVEGTSREEKEGEKLPETARGTSR